MDLSSAVKRVLREADHRIGRLAGPRRVLIEARTPVYLAVLGSLLDAFAFDPRLSVFVTGGDSPAVREALEASGQTRVTWIDREAATWRRFDLLINADPWGTVSLRRCRHRINFFHGVAGKYDLDCPAGMPAGFDTYSRIAFANRDRMERYLAAGIVTRQQAVLVGYPKLDALVAGTFVPAAVRRSLGLDPVRPTVLFAPTWSAASALHLAGEAIIESLLGAGFNVIAKLHDRSLQTSARFTDGIDWRQRLSRFGRRDHSGDPGMPADAGAFALATGADSSPYLSAADAMVTDHSSVGFEYLTLNRPLIVFDAPDLARAARINPEKIALLRSAATVVRTPLELVATVRSELAQPGRLSAARTRVASEMFHQPGSATTRALQVCYELLDVERTQAGRHPESARVSEARLTPGSTRTTEVRLQPEARTEAA
jgi:hypothetical protein